VYPSPCCWQGKSLIKWQQYETDNSKPLDQYAQSDLNGSIISSSSDPDNWTKHGHLRTVTVTVTDYLF
jgi:hypothetical protein